MDAHTLAASHAARQTPKPVQESEKPEPEAHITIVVKRHDDPEGVIKFFEYLASKNNAGCSRSWGCLDEEDDGDNTKLHLDGDGPVRVEVSGEVVNGKSEE